jgi:hypothetical protein
VVTISREALDADVRGFPDGGSKESESGFRICWFVRSDGAEISGD